MEKTYNKFWKKKAAENNISRQDIVVHCALKAFFAKQSNQYSKQDIFRNQISKAFTECKNKNKLANGYKPWFAVTDALYWLTFSNKVPIFGLTKDEIIKDIFSSENEYEAFCIFIKSLAKTKFDFSKRYYTYIFVDQEGIEPIYQAVQASHVAMLIGQKMSKNFNANHIYFQVCKKPDDLTLIQFSDILKNNGLKVESFYEPDINRTIAIGTHPVVSYKRGILKSFDLLTF